MCKECPQNPLEWDHEPVCWVIPGRKISSKNSVGDDRPWVRSSVTSSKSTLNHEWCYQLCLTTAEGLKTVIRLHGGSPERRAWRNICVWTKYEPHSQLLPPIWSLQRLCHCYGSLSLRAFLLKKQKALPLNHRKRHLLGQIILSSTLFLTSQKNCT